VELLVSTREAARRLGIGKTSLFHLLKTELGSVRLGGRTMIPVSELQRFAAALPRRLPGGKMEQGKDRELRSTLEPDARIGSRQAGDKANV
jgi:hypothetical protein